MNCWGLKKESSRIIARTYLALPRRRWKLFARSLTRASKPKLKICAESNDELALLICMRSILVNDLFPIRLRSSEVDRLNPPIERAKSFPVPAGITPKGIFDELAIGNNVWTSPSPPIAIKASNSSRDKAASISASILPSPAVLTTEATIPAFWPALRNASAFLPALPLPAFGFTTRRIFLFMRTQFFRTTSIVD